MKLDKELDPQEDGFAKAYQSKINEYNRKEISKYPLQELRNWYEQFNELFLDINRKYVGFSENAISDIQNMEYKMNFDVAGVYIAQIQNRFLNPINNEINKRHVEESFAKADKSINIGKKSICWAIIALMVTVFFSVLAFLDIKYPKEKTVPIQNECQCDSTKHLTDKSKQLNEIKTCCEDSVQITK